MRSHENKALFQQKKSQIQNRFRSEMGLLIDVVLQGIQTKFHYIMLFKKKCYAIFR